MNTIQAQALVKDSIYQILDNWVFRILAVLALIPILFTFLVGFHEDEIVLLFGLKRWSYGGLLSAFDMGGQGLGQDMRGMAIEALLQIILDFLAGSIGLILCIAATAFFVPRMIEKGAADVLFHKPLSRLTLFLSRYVGGLLFVLLLVTFTGVGIYLGLLLVSNHNDPAILYAILGVTYTFGIVHSVSMLVAVVTRSTVASILLSILFFFGNGCIHNIWVFKEQVQASEQLESAPLEADPEEEGEQTEVEANGVKVKVEGKGVFLETLIVVLDVLHYTLPKTHDADLITQKLRKAVSGPLLRDEDSLFTVYGLPPDVDERPLAEVDASPLPAAVREHLGEPRLHAVGDEATYVVWSRPARDTETTSERTGRTRVRRETASRSGEALEGILEGAGLEFEASSSTFGSRGSVLPTSASQFLFSSGSGEGERSEILCLFRGGDTLYSLWIETEPGIDRGRMEELLGRFGRVAGIENTMMRPNWYEEQLGVDSELKFNIWFSIGSSIAFVLAILGIGWWRLSRIEF